MTTERSEVRWYEETPAGLCEMARIVTAGADPADTGVVNITDLVAENARLKAELLDLRAPAAEAPCIVLTSETGPDIACSGIIHEQTCETAEMPDGDLMYFKRVTTARIDRISLIGPYTTTTADPHRIAELAAGAAYTGEADGIAISGQVYCSPDSGTLLVRGTITMADRYIVAPSRTPVR